MNECVYFFAQENSMNVRNFIPHIHTVFVGFKLSVERYAVNGGNAQSFGMFVRVGSCCMFCRVLYGGFCCGAVSL